MRFVEFNQYKRPDGRLVPVSIARPKPIANKAESLQNIGFRFECEVLQTGEISLTITDGKQDVAIETCINGPEVPEAVDRLIESFYKKLLNGATI